MASEAFEIYESKKNELLLLLTSTINWLATQQIFSDSSEHKALLPVVLNKFKFMKNVYFLDLNGTQISDSFYRGCCGSVKKISDINKDRSHRPYYTETIASQENNLTEPYFSVFDGKLCVTASVPIFDESEKLIGMIVGDCDMDRAISLLDNDEKRRKADPYFKVFYAIISLCLFIISAYILYGSLDYLFNFFRTLFKCQELSEKTIAKPFDSVVLVTLALAIFDLGKTLVWEEILIDKEVKKTKGIRRTLIRFFSTILIAIAIEGLLTVFRFSLKSPEYLLYSAVIIASSAVMLLSLGIFMYFGSKMEKAENKK